MSARFTGPSVSREQPWPGLMPFTEEARAFFHGRDEEVAELLRLIKRQTLTVLFGLSGLGKSSLLNAGLFPQLRDEDFLPIYIRLDVLAPTPFADQALAVLAESAAARTVEAPAVRVGENLWEFFHRRDADFWSAKNRLLTPVLVFDQFEELFTLGRHGADVARRCRDFLVELADLVEGRTPAATIERIERDATLADSLDFSRNTYKVVLSFREDYLPDFEALRGAMPSIMRGRLRLTRMNGSQARAAILESGGHLVSEAVCDQIIRFVASARGRGAEESELDRLEIEPALLSVVCRELNNKRIAGGLSQISADLLEGGAQQEIIREFYQENLADLDPRVAEFIEDQLLTEAGYRDSCALEDALRLPGVSRDAIDTLIGRRLVRLDERAGVLRVELTHDVLTRVAKESRDRRKEREAKRIADEKEAARRRRFRGLIAVGAVVLVGAVGLAAVFALLLERSNEEKRRLVETQSNVLLEQSIGQLERNVPSEPQAVLAEALRLNPDNAAAVARGVTYLSRRTFGREAAERKLATADRGVDLRARAALVISKDNALGVTDLESGAAIAPERKLARAPAAMAIAADRSRIAWEEEGGVAYASLPSGDKALLPMTGGAVRELTFSPDGHALLVRLAADARLFELDPQPRPVELPETLRQVAAREGACAVSRAARAVACVDRRNVSLWSRAGARPGEVASLPHPSPLNALEFSDDGRYLATAGQDKNARVWEVGAARLVGAPLPHEGAVLSAAFNAGGDRLVTGSLDRTARIWTLASGAPVVEPLVGATPVIQARMAADGRRAQTLDAGGRFALWELVAAEAPAAIAPQGERVSLVEASPDGRSIATLSDKALRVFDVAGQRPAAQRWSRDSQAAAPVLARFSPDSKWLAVALPDGAVELRDAQGAIRRTLRSPGRARLVELSSDGALVAIVSDDVVRIWSAPSGQMHGLPLEARSRISRVQFSPDAATLLTVDADGRVRLWDVASTLPIATIEPSVAKRHVAFAGFTGRGREVVVVEEKLARLFDVLDEKARGYRVAARSQLAFLNTVWSADLDPALRRLVVGGVDGTARMVDLEPLRLAGSAMKHDGVVVGAGFSPDGRWVVTRTEQSTRLWHARTGYPVADALRHEQRVAFAALLGNGGYLMSAEESEPPQVTRINLDFPSPYPAWLPALLEIAGRGRFDKTGTVAPIDNPRAEIAALRSAVDKDSPSTWWRDWGAQVLTRLGGNAQAGGKP